MSRKQSAQPILFVQAVEHAHVNEISVDGQLANIHLQPRRLVGKAWNPESKTFEVLPEGAAVRYHSYYIKQLKDGALLPRTLETAQFAGVPFTPLS